jgi:hypothetical protein
MRGIELGPAWKQLLNFKHKQMTIVHSSILLLLTNNLKHKKHWKTTFTECTIIYPRKPSRGRKPSKLLCDILSVNKYKDSTRLP